MNESIAMKDQHLKAAQDCLTDIYGPGWGDWLVNRAKTLERHASHFAKARESALKEIRERLIARALELRCEAGRHKTARVFHELVSCAATLESFAEEIEREMQ